MEKAAGSGLIIGVRLGSFKTTWKGGDHALESHRMRHWLRFTLMEYGIYLRQEQSISFRSFPLLLQYNLRMQRIAMSGTYWGYWGGFRANI